MRVCLTAAAVLLLGSGLIPANAQGENVKTTSKKVPMPGTASRDLDRKMKADEAMNRWKINVRLSGNGSFDAWLLSPEMIGGLANFRTKRYGLSEKQAQALYHQLLDQYYGDAGSSFYGDKIGFMVKINLNLDINHAEDITSDWRFALVTEDGRVLKPVRLIPQDTLFKASNDPFNRSAGTWYKSFGVVFDNLYPDTKKPILTADTKAISFEVSGTPGQARARFEIDTRKK